MQTQSFHSQKPLFQGFPLCQVSAPLNLPSSPKEELWVSSSTEVPVYAENNIENLIVGIPNSLAIACTTHVFTGNNSQKKAQLRGIIQHLITNNRYDCLLELIQKLMGDQAFGSYLNDFYAGNQNANFPTFFAHTRNRLELSELYIYGSGRLGNLEQNLILHAGTEQQVVWNPFVEDPSHLADSLLDEHETIASTPEIYTTSATHKSFVIGQKRYEISNHLGNVSSVITDRKFGVPVSGTDPTINYYLADIVTATDYDPYGQVLPGRVWNRSGYRFGFNGQEFDSELGEVWSAEFWEYDASLGRRWDIDPIDYPWQSPYVGLDNNPIFYSDPLGLATTGDGDKKGKKNKGKKNKTPEQAKESKKKVAGNVTDIAGHAGDVANSSPGTLIPDVVIETKRPKSWIRRTGENVGKVVKWLWNNGGEILDGVAQEVVPVYGIIQDIKDLGTGIKERDGLAIGMGLIAFLPGGTLVKKLVHKIQDAKIIKPKKLKTDFNTKGGGHPNDEFIDEEWNLPGSGKDYKKPLGKKRAETWGLKWQSSSLAEAIKRFAPGSTAFKNGQKTIYKNEETGIQIVYDNSGNYFRIENTNLPGNRRYLDLDGTNPSNKVVDGKTSGRNQGEYNEVTHFNNSDNDGK